MLIKGLGLLDELFVVGDDGREVVEGIFENRLWWDEGMGRKGERIMGIGDRLEDEGGFLWEVFVGGIKEIDG